MSQDRPTAASLCRYEAGLHSDHVGINESIRFTTQGRHELILSPASRSVSVVTAFPDHLNAT